MTSIKRLLSASVKSGKAWKTFIALPPLAE